MNKQESITACEAFRSSVMLSVNSMPVSDDLKASLVIRFQGFYLSMLQELITTPVVPPTQP
jgi:hypothetical protein